ncbi:MAG: molybdopterin molybdenumtransferase MoeA, partial [Candidatus Hydrogenedentes bacterium]|nr:molybdopterin molybdenumtransferase MoeA [Candidatus Hydrogenedentota bacterium]
MHILIDPDTAQSLVLEHTRRAEARRVAVDDALGLTLAQDIVADADYPPFDRSMMDGYAVRVADAGTKVRVVGEIAAGGVAERALDAGSAIEIMTGAPCPDGTEAVVPKEDVTREGGAVALPAAIAMGQNITRRGAECAKGAVVLTSGDV